MRRIAAFALSFALAFSLAACAPAQEDPQEDANTLAVTEPADAGAPEPEQTAQTTPEPPPETAPETAPDAAPQPQEEPPAPEETGPKFTEVNETVYATTSVNVRSSYSADSDKVGGLSAGASVTRTGIGDNGWSRIVYGDSVAYVSSDYLTTTKPSTGGNTSNNVKDDYGTDTTLPENDPNQAGKNDTPPTNENKPTQSYEDVMKQWGGSTGGPNRVDPGDPGYRDWLTGQLNG